MYAVIAASGRQYRVLEGDEVLLDGFVEKPNKKIEFDKVLLIVKDQPLPDPAGPGKAGTTVKLGKPYVREAKVIGRVLEHLNGKKIQVVKFRAKSRYRRQRGFRPQLTRVVIEKIIGA